MATHSRGPLGGARLFYAVLLFLLPFCVGEAPWPPVGPTEEAEPYIADSRWGRAVKQKWEDESFENYLKNEVAKVNEFDFWVDLFITCLPAKPDKERQRQDRTTRRKQDKHKGEREKDRKLGRQQGSGPKLAVYGEWLQAYSENPFRGLEQLPLQTFVSGMKEGRERDAVLLQQLEEENAFGSFHVRFKHLRTLTVGVRKRVFTGEVPEGAGAGGAGDNPQAQGNPNNADGRHQQGGPPGKPQGGPHGAPAFQLPVLSRNGVKVPWLDIAVHQYLPAIEGVPQGDVLGRQFMDDLSDALEALDVEATLRAASHNQQKQQMNQIRQPSAPTPATGLT